MNQFSFWLGLASGIAVAALGVVALLRLSRGTFGWLMNPMRRAAFEQWPTAAMVVDRDSWRILGANPAARRSFGYSEDEITRRTLTQLFRGEGVADEDLGACLRRAATPGNPLELQQRCRDGSQRSVEVICRELTLGKRTALALSVHDVTLRRKAESTLLERHQHLDHLAHHDQLTGLPNRLYLAAHMPDAIDQARRCGNQLAVLFLDLDRFKHINDSRGHETGDKLLKTVAQRIHATIRAEDLVVRMGGDEFVVLMRHVKDSAEVNEAAARINAALSAPIVIDGRTLVTTVSIGVALFPNDGADMGELLRHSDTAMYQAKDRGRNNYQVFSASMDRTLRERISIESSLRTALQDNQLDVHYQPIVDIESQHVVALEALLRWKHPTHGYIQPTRFVSVAEEAGLIVPIGDFVMQRALEDMRRWRDGGGQLVPVALNVSPVQLERSPVAEALARLTREAGIEPALLQVELTESAVFERRDSRGARDSGLDEVARLRELGVRIAIDDFGTGYSSLSHLKQWRVDSLKIDRSFVRDLVTDMSDLAIVSAIVAMARYLHIQVVAEGIEGWQQLEKLRQLGCSYGQGFLFARPTPAQECLRYISGQPLDLTQQLPALRILETTGTNDALRALSA
ncbi:MAG: EAL domain-containing protein [Proteobacteria bacterium]|nr:EAL domain-containing protein [Pseudomonadota bacterium]